MSRNPYLPRRDYGWLAAIGLLALAVLVGGLLGAIYLRQGPDAEAGAAAAAAMDKASTAANVRRLEALKASSERALAPVATPEPAPTNIRIRDGEAYLPETLSLEDGAGTGE